MKKQKFEYWVDQKPYEIEVFGNTKYGKDELLIDKEVNIIKNSSFSEEGYTVVPFLSKDLIKSLKNQIMIILNRHIEPVIGKKYSLKTLSNYHLDVNDVQHNKIISSIYNNSGKGINIEEAEFDFSVIEERVSQICNNPLLTCKMPRKKSKQFFIRIIRPNPNIDNNPPHRDVWIPRLKNAVNIHFIISGNSNKSTLSILPGSHLLKENQIKRTDEGALINGIQFTVPSVVGSSKPLYLIRPRMLKDDIMVFSPYTIHGGGPNESNKTRVSLEMRFWKT